MGSKIVWVLLIVNVLLGFALLGQFVKNDTAVAAAGRRPNYILAPGEVVGAANFVVYIIDTENHQLSARSLDQGGRTLVDMTPIDLDRVFQDRGADAGKEKGRR